ncbi:glycosyltransferase [Treponema sp. HNW]|uniref:glycosyltransferase n=1 Tax=Treponema sp. HNW TaxID=3116654 RepID=UPI003D13C649
MGKRYEKMKILLLNYADSYGGAAVAAYRLAHALHSAGHEVTLGVLDKQTPSPLIQDFSYKKTFIRKVLKKLQMLSEYPLVKNFETTNYISHSLNLYTSINVKDINKSDYDIVHLHWINHNMISIRDIARIRKPIVWTMHDSWPFCGAEHHPNILENDTRFITGYAAKNKPVTTKGFDICKIVYRLKKRYLRKIPIHFIAPSNWEHDCLKKSALFKNHDCTVIPNIIDKKLFCPAADVSFIKKLFSIPLDKKIIGFGAANDITDPRSLKGGRYLIDTLKKIKESDNYHLIIFGNANAGFPAEIHIPAFYTGYISSPVILSAIYNCCDIFVCPSVIENLPYTCLESICCGVPVAAFNTGGIPDIIEHKYNGYLALPFDTEDLYRGIIYMFDNLKELSKNCIKKVKKDFDTVDTVQKHANTYKKVLNTRINQANE